MIRYYCEKCKIDVNTSECPVCGERTRVTSEIYWCDECNVPIIDNHHRHSIKKISTDIRPVFPEERLLIEIVLGKPFKFKNDSVWCTTGGRYIVNGEVVKVDIKSLNSLDDKYIREEYLKLSNDNDYDSFNNFIDRFIEENSDHFESIDSEALDYIVEKHEKYDFNSSFVSFSGGKDSTVVSDLVLRALGTPKVVHIFGDTTLEFPETYEYVNRFKAEHRLTPMLNAKNKEKDFYKLCEIIGPPTRMMRWCCTVFKTGAITKYTNTMYKNKNRILTYYGIRRNESASRSKYDRDSDSPKITKQRTVSPIIDWLDVDVWLYILTRNIDFNKAYRLGFARVGCWCCPNNSVWSEFLSKIHHPDDFYRFRKILIDNAIKVGKKDPEEYVSSGMWKAKQGGEGMEYSSKKVISFEPCATEENAYNYVLQKPIDENLFEMFKPFGELNYDLGNKRLNEVYVLDRNKNVLLKIQGKMGDTKLKVSIITPKIAGSKSYREAEMKVKCQLTKFQMCLNCSACMSVCRFGAIKIKYENDKLDYRIDESKCVHCFECINHFNSGCYLRKVLATREE